MSVYDELVGPHTKDGVPESRNLLDEQVFSGY